MNDNFLDQDARIAANKLRKDYAPQTNVTTIFDGSALVLNELNRQRMYYDERSDDLAYINSLVAAAEFYINIGMLQNRHASQESLDAACHQYPAEWGGAQKAREKIQPTPEANFAKAGALIIRQIDKQIQASKR